MRRIIHHTTAAPRAHKNGTAATKRAQTKKYRARANKKIPRARKQKNTARAQTKKCAVPYSRDSQMRRIITPHRPRAAPRARNQKCGNPCTPSLHRPTTTTTTTTHRLGLSDYHLGLIVMYV
jgi:hypothetical protein